jgi:ribose 5-phosphate isomerase B
MKPTIGIAADHAGFELKEQLKNFLSEKFFVKDFGTNSSSSMDYPDVVHPLCKALISGEFDKAVLICGSGQGVSITANKYAKIRAALCWNAEIAELSRKHNNANIISLPARFIDFEKAKQCVETFFNTAFEGGRHQNRVDKISAC